MRANCRMRKTCCCVFVLMCVAIYVLFSHQINQKYYNESIEVTAEEKDPYRFQLPHAWAWNDDVIYIDKRKNNETTENQTNRLNQDSNDVTYKSASLSQGGTDYGQSRFVGLEGVEDYILSEDDYHEQRNAVSKRIEKCSSALFNVLFLKTHHTGSDIITNILNRFADLHDLKVAIPNAGVTTFYWPARFHWRYLDLSINDGVLPNILCNHARFNADIMDQIMPPKTTYITILRHPRSNFESTFRNEQFTGVLDMYEYSNPIGSFLDDPKMHIKHVIKHNMFKDSLNLIKNGMFFDLGLRTADYHKPQIVKDAIFDLDDKFTLVLIYEHLDESLVLLKRKLCWQLDDVLYLKSHFQEEQNENDFSFSENERLKNWSKADFSLYNYFNKSLWEKIAFEEDFFEELKLFQEKQQEIEEDCQEYRNESKTDDDKSEANFVRSMNKYLCDKMIVSTGNYLAYFRTKMTSRKQGLG